MKILLIIKIEARHYLPFK